MRALRPDSFEVRRDELRQLVRRSREVVLLAAMTGLLTGLGVRGFEYIVEEIYRCVLEAPLWVTALAPALGLVCSALVLRSSVGGGASPSTSDEYLRAFHDPAYRLRPRYVAARITAAVFDARLGWGARPRGPIALRRFGVRRADAAAVARVRSVAATTAPCWSPARPPASPRSSRRRRPVRSSRWRCRTATTWPAGCCCRRSWPSATGYLTFVTLSDTTPLLSVGEFTIQIVRTDRPARRTPRRCDLRDRCPGLRQADADRQGVLAAGAAASACSSARRRSSDCSSCPVS